MEKEKKQDLFSRKSRFDKTVEAAALVSGAATIGMASYAYGQYRAAEKHSNHEAVSQQDVDINTGKTPVDPDMEEQDVSGSVKEENTNVPDKETADRPEPIAHTDGIDFVIQVENTTPTERNITTDAPVAVVVPEPAAGNLPEPILPEPELGAECEIADREFASAGAIRTSGDEYIDFIANDIQQDLFG